MNTIDKNEIRRLLDLYYEGQTSVAQERILSEFFSGAADLPPEWEADKMLFDLMSQHPGEEIAPVHDKRIMESLEKEISKGKNFRRWRGIWYAAASVAACMLIVWLGLRLLTSSESAQDLKPKLAVNAKIQNLPADTAVIHVDPVNGYKGIGIENVTRDVAPKQKEVQKKNRTKDNLKETNYVYDDSNETSYYLSYEEERELEEGNYRVVSDEREAYAIVNSVFSRLDGNMKESNYRIGDINDQYEKIVTKL